MLAIGSLGTLYTDRLAGEGVPGLMPCFHESHAADNAVAELSNLDKRSASGSSPPLMRHLAGNATRISAFPAFHIRHLVPPPARFFVVADKKLSDGAFWNVGKTFCLCA